MTMNASTGLSTVGILPSTVAALIRRTAEAVILPRFRTLTGDQIREKRPGDWVTVADTEAEAMLGRLLTEAASGTVACGEESVARDPSVLEVLDQAAPVWMLDPVDGTANFVRGCPNFTVLVALIERGVTMAGWLHDPIANLTIHASRGGGAWCGDQRLRVDGRLPLAEMIGSAYGRVNGIGPAQSLVANGRVRAIANTGCGGIDYLRMALGETHFKVSSISLPWDHAAGMLVMAEAGATARFLDGGEYDVRDLARPILIAPSAESWSALQAALSGQP
jgi:fructose-1,6-bisphosphatase/inositol monophosphatase family enzyme